MGKEIGIPIILIGIILFFILRGGGVLTGLKFQDSPFGIHDPQIPEIDSATDIANIGVKWIRFAGRRGISWGEVESQKGRFDWSYYDNLYSEIYKNGIKIFITLGVGNKAYGSEYGYLPSDLSAYLSFLKKAVERYDGIWQIDNEPDNFWKDSRENYAKLLKESYKVIKQTNPQAKVAIAGVGSYHGFYDFYIPLMKELTKIRDNPADRYFDIFDFHWFLFGGQYNYFVEPQGETAYLEEYINKIKQILIEYGYDNTPIFITETAQYSDQPTGMEFHSEVKQALDLIKVYIYALSKGVEKLFWVTLTEWYGFESKPNGEFDNAGLINNPQNDGQSHKKLSYYTYKKMVEILEGSDWNNIQTIQESDGIYIYVFTNQGKPVVVIWNDNSDSRQVTITGISSAQVKVTEVVPEYESGEDVTDYNTAFKKEMKSVSSGEITLTLEDIPMFIEEG